MVNVLVLCTGSVAAIKVPELLDRLRQRPDTRCAGARNGCGCSNISLLSPARIGVFVGVVTFLFCPQLELGSLWV